jgi:hypothetical protein
MRAADSAFGERLIAFSVTSEFKIQAQKASMAAVVAFCSNSINKRLPTHSCYGAIWNRRPGGAPAMYSTIFKVSAETSLQSLRTFISWVGASQSLFDSQVTFVQLVCFSQEHTVTGRLPASTNWSDTSSQPK